MIKLFTFANRFDTDDFCVWIKSNELQEFVLGFSVTEMITEAIDEDDAGTRGLGAADGDGKVIAIFIALLVRSGSVIDAHDNRPCGLDHRGIYFLEPFGFEVDAFGGGEIEEIHAGEFAFAEHLAIVLDDVDGEAFGPGEVAGEPRIGLRRWRYD